jgi:hypothetical protein
MACAIRGLWSWKVFLVVLIVVAGNSVAAATPYQLCFNKINSSPQAPPPPPSSRLRCLRFDLVAPDLAGFEVDLRAVPSDPPPGSPNLLPGVVPHLLNLVSPATTSPPLLFLPDPKYKQPTQLQIRGRLRMIPPEASQKNPRPVGIRFRAPSTSGDEKLLHLSVARCGLPQQLGRPLFNRRKRAVFPPCCSRRWRYLSSPPACSSPAQSR